MSDFKFVSLGIFILSALIIASLFFSGTSQEKVFVKKTSPSYFKNMTITAYTPCEGETDETPNETALLEKPVPGWTCAVSQDLMRFLGKRVYIKDLGVFYVNDLMNKRHEKRIDLCKGTKSEAIRFGKKTKEVVFYAKN